MPLSRATVSLPEGMRACVQRMRAQLDKTTGLSNEAQSATGFSVCVGDLSLLHDQNNVTVFVL